MKETNNANNAIKDVFALDSEIYFDILNDYKKIEILNQLHQERDLDGYAEKFKEDLFYGTKTIVKLNTYGSHMNVDDIEKCQEHLWKYDFIKKTDGYKTLGISTYEEEILEEFRKNIKNQIDSDVYTKDKLFGSLGVSIVKNSCNLGIDENKTLETAGVLFDKIFDKNQLDNIHKDLEKEATLNAKLALRNQNEYLAKFSKSVTNFLQSYDFENIQEQSKNETNSITR